MTAEQQAEADAIKHLTEAHKAMTTAAKGNTLKELYACEILDILKRLRGDHGA